MTKSRSTGTGPSRRMQAATAVALCTTLLVAACQPQPSGPPLRSVHGSFVAATLTPDGNNTYTFVDQSPGFTASAPTTNRGRNLRVAVLPGNAPVSVDQQSCITWDGPIAGAIQPGVTLRVRSETGLTQAIMVTNNIYYSYRTGFNVHVTVSVADPQFVQVGSVVLPDAVGPDPFHQTPPPWRMCARAVGSTVHLKVWAIEQHPGEPAWDDARYAGAVTVPDKWVYAGQPGYYVGHLDPGQSTSFQAGAVETLTGGPGEDYWARALAWSDTLASVIYGRPPSPDERIINAASATRGGAGGLAALASLLGEGRQASGRIIRTDLFGPAGVAGLSAQALTVPANGADAYAADAVSAPGANQGFDDAQYVQALYQRILGRQGSPAEIASWTRQIRGFNGRRTVALGFYRSTEHRRREARAAVDAVLGRPATAQETRDLAARLPALGYDPIRLRSELVASQAPTLTGA